MLHFTQGDSASGATAYYNDSAATQAVAVYGTTSTAAVKSKTANALSLYDMSGNIIEWCFDLKYGSERAYRGGGWVSTAYSMQLGDWASAISGFNSVGIGFRLARTP